jgi:tetratricopeptide (TPR) repeat protein
LERARSLPEASGEADLYRKKLIGRALFLEGMMSMGMGDIPTALQVLREGIAHNRLTGDKQMLGYCLGMYFTAAKFINVPDMDEAAREGFAIFSQEVKDEFGLRMAYMNMVTIAAKNGNESEKQFYMEKVREAMRAAPGSYELGILRLFLGMEESAHGNYAEAKKIFEEAIEQYKDFASLNFILVFRSEIGHVERHTGNLGAARAIYQGTIRDWQVLGNRAAVANQLECFGFLAITDKETRRAANLFGAAEALREKCQSPMADYEQVEYDRWVAQVREALEVAKFEAAWAEGRGMAMEQAVQLATTDYADYTDGEKV